MMPGSHLSVSSFLNNHSVFLTISPIKKNTHTLTNFVFDDKKAKEKKLKS